jgi:hypothetical protein
MPRLLRLVIKLLQQHFGYTTATINLFKQELKNTKKLCRETIEDYLQRLLQNIALKKQKGK